MVDLRTTDPSEWGPTSHECTRCGEVLQGAASTDRLCCFGCGWSGSRTDHEIDRWEQQRDHDGD